MMPRPSSSPWGQIQDAAELAPGIMDVSTASHGGIMLDHDHADRLAIFRIHNWLKCTHAWEEDSDWSIPYWIFADEIQDHLEEIGACLEKWERFCRNLGYARREFNRRFNHAE